jgi:hypothetical protein
MESMLESCYTYGGYERGSYGFERYLQKYEDILGKELFDEIYEKKLQDLRENYIVLKNTSTGMDGLTYNSLIPKEEYYRKYNKSHNTKID